MRHYPKTYSTVQSHIIFYKHFEYGKSYQWHSSHITYNQTVPNIRGDNISMKVFLTIFVDTFQTKTLQWNIDAMGVGNMSWMPVFYHAYSWFIYCVYLLYCIQTPAKDDDWYPQNYIIFRMRWNLNQSEQTRNSMNAVFPCLAAIEESVPCAQRKPRNVIITSTSVCVSNSRGKERAFNE